MRDVTREHAKRYYQHAFDCLTDMVDSWLDHQSEDPGTSTLRVPSRECGIIQTIYARSTDVVVRKRLQKYSTKVSGTWIRYF